MANKRSNCESQEAPVIKRFKDVNEALMEENQGLRQENITLKTEVKKINQLNSWFIQYIDFSIHEKEKVKNKIFKDAEVIDDKFKRLILEQEIEKQVDPVTICTYITTTATEQKKKSLLEKEKEKELNEQRRLVMNEYSHKMRKVNGKYNEELEKFMLKYPQFSIQEHGS